jgi:hypothetical protein
LFEGASNENAEDAEVSDEVKAELYDYFIDSLAVSGEPIPRIFNPIVHCTDNDGKHTTAKTLGTTEVGAAMAEKYAFTANSSCTVGGVLYKELKKQATSRRKPAMSENAQVFKEFETNVSLKAVKNIFIDDQDFDLVENMKELLKIMKAAEHGYLEELVQASWPLFKKGDDFLYVIGASKRDILAVSEQNKTKNLFVVCGPYLLLFRSCRVVLPKCLRRTMKEGFRIQTRRTEELCPKTSSRVS